MKQNTPLADEYLKSAESLPEQTADEFFYTRLIARMENSIISKAGWNFSLRPSLLIGVLAVLLCINGFFFVKQEKSQPQSTGSGLQTFASSYDLTISTPY